MKKTAWSSILVATVLLTVGVVADAQQPKKVARVCYLGNAISGQQATNIKPFRERLPEIGYVEGQNLTNEFRHSEGKDEHLPELAADLVRLNCDVILTAGDAAAQTAKNATKTIPIVMAFGADAVRRESETGADFYFPAFLSNCYDLDA